MRAIAASSASSSDAVHADATEFGEILKAISYAILIKKGVEELSGNQGPRTVPNGTRHPNAHPTTWWRNGSDTWQTGGIKRCHKPEYWVKLYYCTQRSGLRSDWNNSSHYDSLMIGSDLFISTLR